MGGGVGAAANKARRELNEGRDEGSGMLLLELDPELK